MSDEQLISSSRSREDRLGFRRVVETRVYERNVQCEIHIIAVECYWSGPDYPGLRPGNDIYPCYSTFSHTHAHDAGRFFGALLLVRRLVTFRQKCIYFPALPGGFIRGVGDESSHTRLL